jgi:hypothetical protein
MRDGLLGRWRLLDNSKIEVLGRKTRYLRRAQDLVLSLQGRSLGAVEVWPEGVSKQTISRTLCEARNSGEGVESHFEHGTDFRLRPRAK